MRPPELRDSGGADLFRARRSGDANNATLAAVGYNFSLLLRWLRLLLRLILAALPQHPAPAAKPAAA